LAALAWFLVMAAWPRLEFGPNAPAAVAQDEEEAEEPTEKRKPKGKKAAKADNAAEDEEDSVPAGQNTLMWLINASGPFGMLIGIQSILLVAFIFSNAMLLRRQVFIPPQFVEQFEGLLNNKQYPEAFELAKADDSFLARVLMGGLQRLNRGYDECIAGMEQVAEDENMAVDHKLSYISIIGATAPMLGLLGTVQGMVSSFTVIAQSTTSPKPSELANGITLALVTTMEGLIVAIPAVIAYTLLKNMQSRLVLDVGMVADGLMSRFSPNARKAAPGGSTGAASPG
jgi:biopolymer transport protein ExbB